MSRSGKKPVAVPDGVEVSVAGRKVTIKGKLGTLAYEHRPEVTVAYDAAAKQIVVTRKGDERQTRAYHGMTRALLANMVEGVTKGYERGLEIVGRGYEAKLQGKKLLLTVGYADTREFQIPDHLKVEVPTPTVVVVKGCDKQAVGELAAEIRATRKPEPYLGKGIRYRGEVVRRKAGKAFAGTGG
ncbi:MAG TPA: 50S ribosomal protein L6 [Phycisphaerae bacterium]|nr:50S ribosomal protein L6 [Phycisphaerae bacterium]